MQKIALIDSDSSRRASFVNAGVGDEIHVEPFENVEEFLAFDGEIAGVLYHDEGDASPTEALLQLESAEAVITVAAYRLGPDINRVIEAIRAGFADYIIDVRSLRDVLRRALLSFDIMKEVTELKKIRRTALQRLSKLSPREREVLDGVLQGSSNKQIAHALGISDRTVEIHRGSMMRKIDARGIADAVRIGMEARIAYHSMDMFLCHLGDKN